jgi:DNA-directed RNA polymerase specialized sigma24 family protein
MTEPDSGKGPDWSVIYVSHAPALYGRSRWALGGREPHTLAGIDADDAVQETFTSVMKRGMRYVGTEAQVRSYLHRQLSWVLSDAYEEQDRRRGRRDLQQEVGDTGIEDRSSSDARRVQKLGRAR